MNKTNANDSGEASFLYDQKGLTKREYFAVLMLQGMLANSEYYSFILVERAVKAADDLITELNKESK